MSFEITHGSTLAMLKAAYARWEASLDGIKSAANISWSLSLEPLPSLIYNRGSNSLGLGDRTKPLVVTLLNAMWTDIRDDEMVEKMARRLYSDLQQDAQALDEYDSFVYLNYAAPWQDPISSYGATSVARLKAVREQMDPMGVFTKQVPGGFKIK